MAACSVSFIGPGIDHAAARAQGGALAAEALGRVRADGQGSDAIGRDRHGFAVERALDPASLAGARFPTQHAVQPHWPSPSRCQAACFFTQAT